MTTELLTLIEDNPTYKVAFGFDKGLVGTVPTGGKKLIEHHRALARKVLVEDLSSKWDEGDIKKLGEVIKNRIGAYVDC